MKIYLSKDEKPYQAQIEKLVDRIIATNPNFNGYTYEILDSEDGSFWIDSDDTNYQSDLVFNSIQNLIDDIKQR